MSAPSMRRHRSYFLTLPLVILVVFLLVAKLVAIQRAEIIAELSSRVAHRDPEDASAAVRQLGEMPQPPAAVLVAAASGADRRVAQESQQAIGKLLRRAQQRIKSGRGTKAVARQLTELARELADHRHAFPAADQAWLVGTAQRILRLANQIPPKHAPVVAANCDLILTSVPAANSVAAQPDGPKDQSKQALPAARQPVAAQTAAENSPTKDVEPADTVNHDAIFAPWRADWSQPAFRTLPSQPDPGQGDPKLSPRTSSGLPPELPEDTELLGRPMAQLETCELLRKWHDTNGSGLSSLEKQTLIQRGFDPPSAKLVKKLFSTPQDRMQLVDDVQQAPGVNASPWLILLAADPDAEVRLAAVTMMATSTDAALIEQAWQAAIHDGDPRVAALASRLRERRAAVRRR